ncbi:MAG: metal ABC transporter substrate-binding protein [Enterococcaceae bacterium]|jgi:zinc transport system substrate-binding protein|nr:metal ABC transporter substrate-binding protein [Enterococcaceae bacterium]MCI1920206.1 metal ABC transporter substrate-binding protein [Enterococcaceae bacterium]
MKKKKMIFIAAVFALGLLASCGRAANENSKTSQSAAGDSSQKIQVIASFYPMYEFTKEVLGKEGTVQLLVKSGVEPHDYEPSAKDIANVTKADVFVYNSPDMETWAKKVTANLSKKTLTIEAAKKIKLVELHEESSNEDTEAADAHAHELDPHVWLDPVLAQKEVQTIADALSKKYPQKKAVFQANAENYIAKLQKLDKDYHAALDPAKQRIFVTQHAAFGYLAKQYGLTQEAVMGLTPDEEPSAARLAELKKVIEENHVKVVYFEESATPKVAQTLANGAGIKTAVLNPLESLTEKEQKAGENYISVMQKNLKALRETIQ